MNTLNNVTVKEALAGASSFLRQHQIPNSLFVAEVLMRHVLGLSRSRFYTVLADELEPEKLDRFWEAVKRRAAGEPVQYITGKQEFYGLDFGVNPSVLIPRPETEILVEEISRRILQLWPEKEPLTLIDVGTGSGAISVALAVHHPELKITATDLSSDALHTAKQNARRHGVEQRIRFIQGNLLDPLLENGEQADIIVSNPPYIPSGEIATLDVQVREREPRMALDGGEDGLQCYRRITGDLPSVLKKPGLIGFEVGMGQAEAVAALLHDQCPGSQVDIIPDLAGIDRVVIATTN
ncbi:MAG: peptide chain release factor N(5)-glutamine methyltransferase [Bacillaceae bacterium]|nr:peptide chain release factor N(5)-glutamine methyltransferase [Bacillaceae bacterium]